MEPISIKFTEDQGLVRRGEVVTFGVPLEKGGAAHGSVFMLSDAATGEPVRCQVTPCMYWADGSPRWVTIRTAIDLEAGAERWLKLTPGNPLQTQKVTSPSIDCRFHPSYIEVDTGALTARLTADDFRWFAGKRLDDDLGSQNHEHEVVLLDAGGSKCSCQIDSAWKPVQQSDCVLVLEAHGRWFCVDGKPLAKMACRLHFFAGSDVVSVETQLHNPQRARHAGGLWDLGDPGSIHFTSLEILVSHSSAETAYLMPELHGQAICVPATEDLQIYQASSGGVHWDSRNHIDARGEQTVSFRGYRTLAGAETVFHGERATPVAGLTGPSGSVWGSLKQFWQNFPSALALRKNELAVGLFPSRSAGAYELQGGERKTHTAYLYYGEDKNALQWTQSPLVPVVGPGDFDRGAAFPWFRHGRDRTELDFLIQRGLDGPRDFFSKREAIDEYGWRNFGDVFADHETHYQPAGQRPLISHYNNQYDAIYGFARQFAYTGDRRWFELMDDLARHVTDIDIYHTDEDRAEYNNGLFWHTDHYLDAHTATHRTFTRHNDTSSTPGQTGGGPASEHCYTTGLLYHYLLTGAQSSRQAVLELAHWMVTAHEGQGGLLEQLLALKKNEVPKLKAMVRGERPLAHRYPFTRGTGNYLNALLDASLIEPQANWLGQAEGVIRNTIHPEDDIDKRDLLDVETGWSYLILLASLVRYLQIKDERGERDSAYAYGLKSFLRYAAWMRDHERPFLSYPDQLEFANDTWVAQDVRKAMLMFQAATLCASDAQAYYAKGCEWLDYVCDRLRDSEEAHYARILIILLQNYGPQHLEPEFGQLVDPKTNDVDNSHWKAPRLTWTALVARMAGRLLRGIRTFHPGREKAWLHSRLDRT